MPRKFHLHLSGIRGVSQFAIDATQTTVIKAAATRSECNVVSWSAEAPVSD